MKLKKHEILAKNLLIKYVNNSKNYFDFNILKTNKAVTIDKNKTNILVYHGDNNIIKNIDLNKLILKLVL